MLKAEGKKISVPAQVRNALIEADVCGDVAKKCWERTFGDKTFVLETDRGECFVKVGTGGDTTAPPEWLEYEAESLRRISKLVHPYIKVPEPWLVGELGPGRGFMVMDFVKLAKGQPAVASYQGEQEAQRTRRSVSADDTTRLLAQGLAQMHSAPPPPDWQTFGFPMDGCCGACPQNNNVDAEEMNWMEFWRDYRLGHQLEMLYDRDPSDAEVHELGAELTTRLPEFFEDLDGGDSVAPCLLHGDLWEGNIGRGKDGYPVLFDPACYYGHWEAEQGMYRMFGGGILFEEPAYTERFPQGPGFARRAVLYELQHCLNHYNIFGSGYRQKTVMSMKALLR